MGEWVTELTKLRDSKDADMKSVYYPCIWINRMIRLFTIEEDLHSAHLGVKDENMSVLGRLVNLALSH